MIKTGERPVVSVCIQTYQHAAYIKECLDSVLSQETGFPFEIILGEDDSTDGTREICTDYAARHPGTIRLFLRPEKKKIYINAEKTGRFNFLQNLAAASGKYIAILDGDDYWSDHLKLQKQVDFMEANPDCSLSCHKASWRNKSGPVYSRRMPGWPDMDTKYSLLDFLHSYNNIIASTTMFPRSNMDDLPAWFSEVPVIDYPMHIHNAQKGKIAFLADTMTVYRIHPGGRWSGLKWPQHLILLWHLYTVMASNMGGDLAAAMARKRSEIGLGLVKYFKDHSWKSKEWYKKEFRNQLEQRKFEQDEIILRSLQSSLSVRNYLMNGWNAGKEVGKLILKRT